MAAADDEDDLLRSVALKNAGSILRARQRVEEEVIRAKEALEQRTDELAHSLAMIRATLESTTDGILVTDQAGRITDINERCVRMWDLTGELVEARSHRRVLRHARHKVASPREFLDRVAAIYAEAPPESYDLLELSDGRTFEQHSRIQLVAGRKVGRVWSFRDVTEQRQTEARLQEESRLLELLNRTSTQLISKLDLGALVQAVTDAATELSGAGFGAFFYNSTGEDGEALVLYTLSGAPREAFEHLGHPRATALFGPTFRGEGVIRIDDVLKDARYGRWPPHFGMPRGHLPVRSYLATPVVSRSGEVIGGLFFGHPEPGAFTERTERIVVGVAAQAAVAIDNARLYEGAQRAAEERRHLLDSERAARAAAERASAMKDEFLATLSHELRTPLSAILGWSRVLLQQVKDQADLRQAVETIERNARVQTQLIADLLDMSRITSGKLRLDIQTIEPVAFIEAAIETVRHAAEAKRIRIEAILDDATGPTSGDASRLQQIMWNLLSNAIKFTPEGGRVQVALKRVNSHIEIDVTDTGIGIRPEFLPHVFERFRQADASAARTYGGLGLGLAIVKQLTELHGGTCSADSAGAGCGTTFTVRLPAAPVRQLRRTPRAVVEFDRPDLAGIRVLVVDDEVDGRELVKRVLTDCQAQVLSAAGAAEALALLEKERPDVLVSDIGMPDVDGYELLRRVRALGQERGERIPAIALTAFARTEDRTRALRAGFLVHLSKPVEPSELAATVATVTGRA